MRKSILQAQCAGCWCNDCAPSLRQQSPGNPQCSWLPAPLSALFAPPSQGTVLTTACQGTLLDRSMVKASLALVGTYSTATQPYLSMPRPCAKAHLYPDLGPELYYAFALEPEQSFPPSFKPRLSYTPFFSSFFLKDRQHFRPHAGAQLCPCPSA